MFGGSRENKKEFFEVPGGTPIHKARKNFGEVAMEGDLPEDKPVSVKKDKEIMDLKTPEPVVEPRPVEPPKKESSFVPEDNVIKIKTSEKRTPDVRVEKKIGDVIDKGSPVVKLEPISEKKEVGREQIHESIARIIETAWGEYMESRNDADRAIALTKGAYNLYELMKKEEISIETLNLVFRTCFFRLAKKEADVARGPLKLLNNIEGVNGEEKQIAENILRAVNLSEKVPEGDYGKARGFIIGMTEFIHSGSKDKEPDREAIKQFVNQTDEPEIKKAVR